MRSQRLSDESLDRGQTLLRDAIAGISVALILIPQALAYAEIAGVPSYVGLYAAALPPIVAAVFASSPYLQTGPVAMTALLAFGGLSAFAEPFTQEWVELAALLALLVGVVRVVIGLVRGGFIAFLMSQPVLLGFTSGASILIVASQLPKAFGVNAEGDTILERLLWTITNPGAWDIAAIGFAIATIVIVVGGRRLSGLFPGVLVAVVAAIVLSELGSYSGAVVGQIPTGFPPVDLALPWGSTLAMIPPAIVIALVGFAEPSAIARQYATEERQRWDPNREFISQGAANLASAVSGGFPVGGSFSRSSVNKLAGARTRVSGAITGFAVLMFLPVAFVLEVLPQAVLGGIVVAAVSKLIRPDQIVRMYRQSTLQAIIASVTFIATLVLSPRIDLAIVIGVGLGVVIHLWREITTHVDADFAGGTLTLMPAGVMFFGSAPGLFDSLIDVLAEHPETERIVLDLSRLGRLDYTGAVALRELMKDARLGGLEVEITQVPPQSQRIVEAVLSD